MRSWIHSAYCASLTFSENRFRNALRYPQKHQDKLLRDVLVRNEQCQYGKVNGFSGISGVDSFQRRVPIADYADLSPWVDKIKAGEPGVLTTEPVLMLEKSGGSTGANKYIPYTQSLLTQMSRATQPWIRDLYRCYPALRETTQYWSISPAIRTRETTSGGIPIGLEDDTEYFDPLSRWAIKRILTVPQEVRLLTDWEEWRHVTSKHLLNDPALGLISVWSPTFLLALAEYIVTRADVLCREIAPERSRRLRSILDSAEGGCIALERMWPKLSVISCWCDGESRTFVPQLRRYFPCTPLQSKGLLATEGFVSVPYGQLAKPSELPTEGAPIAIDSHFLEFIDLNKESATPKLASELQVGGIYSPLITTAGGLYRYHLKDIVECVGVLHRTPTIAFRGKLDRVCDIAGEKLHIAQIDSALTAATEQTGIQPVFALVAPRREAPRGYCLFLESSASDLALANFTQKVDAWLAQSHHYAYCRQLNQLGALTCVRVKRGWHTYQNVLMQAGHTFGAIKPTVLEYKYDWHAIFSEENTHDSA